MKKAELRKLNDLVKDWKERADLLDRVKKIHLEEDKDEAAGECGAGELMLRNCAAQLKALL